MRAGDALDRERTIEALAKGRRSGGRRERDGHSEDDEEREYALSAGPMTAQTMGLAGPEDGPPGPFRRVACPGTFFLRVMIEDLPLLFERLHGLLDHRPDVSSAPHAEDVEHTLTDGYAGALALERERERTRRHIHKLASGADSAEHARELQKHMTLLRRTEEQLAELRSLLREVAATRQPA
jgi:hypothetical protein